MDKERGYKNFVIGGLLVAVVTLSVAFALFESNLEVSGTAKVLSSVNNWNVVISSIKATKGGYAVSTATDLSSDKTATKVEFECSLATDEDSCTLTGTVKNLGQINAKYTGYKLAIDSSNSTSSKVLTNDDIKVTYTEPLGWEENETVLTNSPADTGDFELKIEPNEGISFNSDEGDETYKVSLTLNFEQAAPTA